jgi:hypothetical protein
MLDSYWFRDIYVRVLARYAYTGLSAIVSTFAEGIIEFDNQQHS